MTSAAITKREAVASAIRTAVESLEGGWAAYASPVDVVSLPCVLIGPGEPYRERMTMGLQGTFRERIRLTGNVFLNRATGNTALDIFDEAADAVIGALEDVSYSTDWKGMRLLGEVEVNGHDALGAVIDIEVL